jgi:hypothetical protein
VSKGAALPYFLTLTLPDEMFNDSVSEFAKDAKHWLDTFLKRLRRVCPVASGFWKIEWQARKSGPLEGKLFPHFHLLVFQLPERTWETFYDLPNGNLGVCEHREAYVDCRDLQLSLNLIDLWCQVSSGVQVSEKGQMSIEGNAEGVGAYRFAGSTKFVRRCDRLHTDVVGEMHGIGDKGSKMLFQDWAAQAWYYVVDSHNLDHLQAGVRVERVRTWEGVMFYAAKYLGKADCEFLSELPMGRCWGIFNREQVPWAKMLDINLDNEVGVRLRRVARRYLARRLGRRVRAPYGITLYCDVTQFRRLWDPDPPDPF